jgi:hypothetical protein
MRKNQIDKLLKSANTIEDYLGEVKSRLECSKSHNPKDYRDAVEREQARESFEYCENELLLALLEINKLTEAMVKKIDPEAWREK